ncbi:hypothetical protein B0H16DRAFT_1504481 [Mycena metata]|uniref:Uncharacterized protein n=1 Tax=Mycena metata TaxID=1033252 RepID=A0AAD7NVS4_9AGAR|nr:hypothetical protein B0H16DRAFT_1504481 [Mycena metata]
MQFKLQLTALIAAAATFSHVSAYTGRAEVDALGTTPCPVQCPLTDYRAALPIDLFPNGEHCCDPVYVSYEGKNIKVTFTDLCLYCQGTTNLSLSHQAFAELAPLELGSIYPVVWNL